MKLIIKTKKKKFKAEVNSIEDTKELMKSFCEENNVDECSFQLNGEAKLKTINEDTLTCLFG